MRIAYVVPGLGPCGGIRVVVEHCNRLAARGHDVYLAAPQAGQPSWIRVTVPIVRVQWVKGQPFDIVVATGYQTVPWVGRMNAARRCWFMQMLEYHFCQPGTPNHSMAWDAHAYAKRRGFHVITIADWLVRGLRDQFGIEADHVPNGINFDHFYPEGEKANAIVIEGDQRNPAKDVEAISWRVGLALREEFGVALWGYAGLRHAYTDQFDRFIVCPTQAQMRRMYSRAQFLLKASRYEGRSLAPLEAMACGTTYVRGIIEGDDDLCFRGLSSAATGIRCRYDYDEVYETAAALLARPETIGQLSRSALAYAKTHLDWEPIIDQLEQTYTELT